MIADDRGTFDRAFRRVSRAFRVHLKADELADLSLTYFRILESFSLDRVLLAAKRCITTARRFPTAAEWLAAVDTSELAPADVRTMDANEVDERAEAEATGYEGQPCRCQACVRAGVDDRPLRYVPTYASLDTDERAFNPYRNAVQPVGHWAHGEELARWYAARDHFFKAAPPPLKRVLALVPVLREPGEDD